MQDNDTEQQSTNKQVTLLQVYHVKDSYFSEKSYQHILVHILDNSPDQRRPRQTATEP